MYYNVHTRGIFGRPTIAIPLKLSSGSKSCTDAPLQPLHQLMHGVWGLIVTISLASPTKYAGQSIAHISAF